MIKHERPTFLKLYLSVSSFIAILLFGTFGYMLLEHFPFFDAIYMTVITISTVGFEETHSLDTAGKVFTIILILTNIVAFTYFIAQTSAYFLDGEFLRTYKLYKMKKAISELNGHIIICGFGRNGMEAGSIFRDNGIEFVAIEKKPVLKDEAPFEVSFFLTEDATRDETLLQAGINHASALLTTLPDDAENLFVVLTARELNPKIKIISRASNDSSVRKLKTAGANNVIMPDKIGGAHMASLVLTPDVKEFMDVLNTHHNEHFSIEEIPCSKKITLSELNCWQNTGATVLGIKINGGEFSLNPSPDTVVQPGSRLIVMGAKEQLRKTAHLVS